MRIICYPQGIVSYNFPRQGLKDAISGGFKDIALDILGVLSHYALKQSGSKRYRRWLLKYPDKFSGIISNFTDEVLRQGLTFSVARVNFVSPESWIKEADEAGEDLFTPICRMVKESVVAAIKAGCRYIIVRPLTFCMGGRDILEANRKLFIDIADATSGYDIEILLEGQYRIHNGSFVRGFLADAYDAADFIDELNAAIPKKIFGAHLDAGICSLLGQNMYDAAVILGSRIKCVTLKDSDGLTDAALLPFTASGKGQMRTDWLNLIRGLRKIDYDGQLVMNFGDTASITSPLLKPALIAYAKRVADFLEWQIEMEKLLRRYDKRALFGAGNMCRAYMKCYGEKYPPLFTTDNDKSKWGTTFCGLMVKSPEELKNLPKDCAILICNIYYREIERQIKEMGIQNPVGYFNDEYMPQFHFERIEDMKEETDAKAWGTDAERR